MWLLEEAPEDGAFIASLRGMRVPGEKTPTKPEAGSPAAVMLAKRRHRGWGTDRELLAQIRDGIWATGGSKRRFPRPESASPDRRVIDLDDFAQHGI